MKRGAGVIEYADSRALIEWQGSGALSIIQVVDQVVGQVHQPNLYPRAGQADGTDCTETVIT